MAGPVCRRPSIFFPGLLRDDSGAREVTGGARGECPVRRTLPRVVSPDTCPRDCPASAADPDAPGAAAALAT